MGVKAESLWLSKRGRAVDNPARAMTMYLCQREGGMKLSEIALQFGLKITPAQGPAFGSFRSALKTADSFRD
jgi:hypothetical protein